MNDQMDSIEEQQAAAKSVKKGAVLVI